MTTILPDGSAITVLAGENGAYDKHVAIDYAIESYGGNLSWLMTPIWQQNNAKLQPIWGLRYFGIRESFGYAGSGSGVTNLTILFPGGERADTEASDDAVQAVDPFRGNLVATVQSHLVGPEIGMRMNVGGDSFRLLGETKVGVMGTFEEMRLKGKGLGNGFSESYDPTLTFYQTQSHRHLSPTFEAS